MLLSDANPTLLQKIMRHEHCATTEIYVEGVQRLLEGAEAAVTQIQARGCETYGSPPISSVVHHSSSGFSVGCACLNELGEEQ